MPHRNKICLITGGNSGIGKCAALQLAALGCTVIIGVRNAERGEKAIQEIIQKTANQRVKWIPLDVSSQNAIKLAAQNFMQTHSRLDVLIHNAADFDISRKKPDKTVDGIERTWATNHLGPVLLTHYLMEALKASEQARIITIASKGLLMHPRLRVHVNDPEFKQRRFSVSRAYYQSKLAQIMYTRYLAEKLKDTSITANCIRVTNVQIDTNRYPNISPFQKFLYRLKSRFSISPETMAETYVYLATSADVQHISGAYFDEKNSQVALSAYSCNEQHIKEVMQVTRQYFIKD